MHFHLPEIILQPLHPNLPRPRIHKIRSILESPSLPTINPFQSPSKPTSFHPNLSTELINPVKLDRGSQRTENKRATSCSLVKELPPPNRVEIEIGYRTNREHGHGVTTIENESLDRIEAIRIERDPVSMDAQLLARGGRISAWIGKAGGRGGVRPRRR